MLIVNGYHYFCWVIFVTVTAASEHNERPKCAVLQGDPDSSFKNGFVALLQYGAFLLLDIESLVKEEARSCQKRFMSCINLSFYCAFFSLYLCETIF